MKEKEIGTKDLEVFAFRRILNVSIGRKQKMKDYSCMIILYSVITPKDLN